MYPKSSSRHGHTSSFIYLAMQSNSDFPQPKWRRRMSRTNVKDECQGRMSRTNVKDECQGRMSRTNVCRCLPRRCFLYFHVGSFCTHRPCVLRSHAEPLHLPLHHCEFLLPVFLWLQFRFPLFTLSKIHFYFFFAFLHFCIRPPLIVSVSWTFFYPIVFVFAEA